MPKEPPRSAADFIPERPTLSKLREAATDCRGCHLWKIGTQTVFGEGGRHAPLMLVGEQPGNEEDLSGHPFVGPAGKLLDRALADAGIDRTVVYVTNVVKHFKWEPRGKRRIHKKPNAAEIGACRPWLDTEIALVKPRVIVCLGATAAQALLGKTFRVTKGQGKALRTRWAPWLVPTWHPSAVLRMPEKAARDEARHQLLEAFRLAARLAQADEDGE